MAEASAHAAMESGLLQGGCCCGRDALSFAIARCMHPVMAGRRTIKPFPGLPFLVAACALIAVAVHVGSSTREFVQHAAHAPGVVTTLNAGGSHPDIEFTTASGKKVRYPQGGFIGGYKPGDRVRVLYDPADPIATASIDDPGALWSGPGAAALFGLGFALIGLISLFRPSASSSPS
jgi:hypothetical protein